MPIFKHHFRFFYKVVKIRNSKCAENAAKIVYFECIICLMSSGESVLNQIVFD